MSTLHDAMVAKAQGVSAVMATEDDPAAGDDAAEVRIDEWAENLRGQGLSPRMAASVAEWMAGEFERRVSGESVEQLWADAKITADAIQGEMLRAVERAERPRFEAQLIMLARGDELVAAKSMRKLAEREGCTVAWVSAEVSARRKLFNFPKNKYNKSDAACEKYAQGNRKGGTNEI